MPAHDDDSARKTIQASATAFTIIEYLSENERAGITEIAGDIDVSKSTVHNHLKTLEQGEYVTQDDSGRYALGYRFLTLGGKVRQRSNLYSVAKPEINWLVEETGESACVATEEFGRIVYLYQARGERAVITDSHTGTRVLPHCTALGKSMLAHLPEERVDEIITRRGLPKNTENTINSKEELFEELAETRDRGYAFDDEERIEGLRCVGAPVMDDDNEVIGALSVSGPAKRVAGERFREKLPELVRRAVRVVEMNHTYS